MKISPYIKYRLKPLSIIAFFVLVTVAFSIRVNSTDAILGFGGEILSAVPCTCSGNYAIVVGTPTPGIYIYEPSIAGAIGTKLDEYFMLWEPGPWVLGTYTLGGVCTITAVPACVPFGNPVTNRTMIEVGTSMMPI